MEEKIKQLDEQIKILDQMIEIERARREKHEAELAAKISQAINFKHHGFENVVTNVAMLYPHTAGEYYPPDSPVRGEITFTLTPPMEHYPRQIFISYINGYVYLDVEGAHSVTSKEFEIHTYYRLVSVIIGYLKTIQITLLEDASLYEMATNRRRLAVLRESAGLDRDRLVNQLEIKKQAEYFKGMVKTWTKPITVETLTGRVYKVIGFKVLSHDEHANIYRLDLTTSDRTVEAFLLGLSLNKLDKETNNL